MVRRVQGLPATYQVFPSPSHLSWASLWLTATPPHPPQKSAKEPERVQS